MENGIIHMCGISDESTESTSYSIFNDDLRWLWNSVYCMFLYIKCKL